MIERITHAADGLNVPLIAMAKGRLAAARAACATHRQGLRHAAACGLPTRYHRRAVLTAWGEVEAAKTAIINAVMGEDQ